MMKTFTKKFSAVALAAAFAMTGLVPAQAMPITVAPKIETSVDVQKVQICRYPDCRPGPRRYYNNRDRYYNGYRGYPRYRHGYRRHSDGFWFPLAAFGTGAIIGSTLAQPRVAPRRAGRINPKHVSWCEDRYRSYRSYDNTFQPYNGPRQQCYSPYF